MTNASIAATPAVTQHQPEANVAGSRRGDERSEAIAKRFEIPVLVAATLVIPVIFIEQSHAGHTWKVAAAVANWAVWLAFAAELVVMLAVSSDRRAWLRAHPLEALVVLVAPPFFPASLQATRVFRLLRLVRLLPLVDVARRVNVIEGVRYTAVLTGVTVLGGGAAFSAAENNRSTWDGVWWAVSTMTTVGYGDITPKTTAGRLIGIAIMVVGIGFAAVLTAALAQRFVAAEVRQDVAATQSDTAGELGLREEELLDELREIAERLRRVEITVQRVAGRARGPAVGR